MSVPKYTNIDKRLPELPHVLRDSIQSEFLEIRRIDKTCEKFKKLSEKITDLQKSDFVVFSKYIKKDDHKHETFAFISDTGEITCHVPGRELELYGMLEGCGDLEVNGEFDCSWHRENELNEV